MTVFLIIVVIALLGVTFWQMSKILNLSKSGHEDASQIANDNDNKNQAYIMFGFVIALYMFMFYSFVEWGDLYLPEAASEHGADYDKLMFISVALIMTVQLITQFLLFFFAYKYRGVKGKKALFYADNDKLEFIWTIIPVIVLAGLIIYGLFTWSDIMNIDEDEDTLVVEIYAYQFGWKARYAGEDNTLGQANVRFIQGTNTVGLDESDGYGMDDKITTELHLPVDRPVLFKFRSQDVLHSAYFPFFRAQMNVVPGMVTQFSFTPTITTEKMRTSEFMVEKVDELNRIRKERSKELEAKGDVALDPYEFEYYLLCNKICGISHFNMQMKIVVEEEQEFNSWISEQGTFGETLKKEEE
ncbi:cytochrome c oxidase subunit II [Mesonia aestuariivivens]|uniref:Cytochrome c oxidase polypeptide II n=1 Tax=Mesonia aestuariivivens TaxID=2796128 RepID=A0ABS6W3L0_9FLAO|nr:cytochrome c oxidase subunit II [Mesonia aestuariivivens]MBW2962453.1 cytochrome c oxidase subunit II [Mesonia aestuariivivens]